MLVPCAILAAARFDGECVVILITGATGFIGGATARALRERGHRVLAATRRRDNTYAETVEADFTRDVEPATWLPRLADVDVLVNTVGVLREQGRQTFDALHVRAPIALFSACVDAGVSRVIQLSALGADQHARSAYHVSKRAADDFLASLPISSAIVQPSLVYGPGGESARLFNTLASLPLIPLPGDGSQRVQPIHIDDVVACIVALVERSVPGRDRVALVGPQPVTLREYLAALSRNLGRPHPRFIEVPHVAIRFAAFVGTALKGALLDPETLAMLQRGNVADASDTVRLLGAVPRPITEFIALRDAAAIRQQAQLNWLLPLVRVMLAAMWIVTGIVSLAVYPIAESYALLARTGITGGFATVALVGSAALDIVFGVATLVAPSKLLWWSQIALIVGYTLIISVFLPEFWAHP
ncbi:MAG TPA: SDR family oxidoreductase, partial [Casimicrobiaceae bacterium]|nr:SDR family oxidoreductase [Casimicrobiaceae bacterium]